jgi:GT2 family glycosyltransferase/glycosyltransferase involved in cell wall biosynthesis
MRRSRIRRRSGLLNDLPRRAALTIQHHGWREFLLRVVTFPLRLVGLEGSVRRRLTERIRLRPVRAWYRDHGRPVTIAVPTYGDPATTIDAVRRVLATVDRSRTRVVVVDDGSPPEFQERLKELRGVVLDLAPENAGFAASVNRAIEAAGPADDLVVLNNDVLPFRHWLERLQYAAYADERRGIVGPKLLYPDGRIQAAGSYRNLGAPEWFDHRYRFKRRDHGPANVQAAALALTGACMYVKRETLRKLGGLDAGYPMAYEDVDYCLKAWESGLEVVYEPSAELTHLESVTRGTEVGERERRSQARFWDRWGDWFDNRRVRSPDGRPRVVYVTEDTGVGGGHRDVFEHLNRLVERGYNAELFSLGGPPEWFPLAAPVRTFRTYRELTAALGPVEAIKVATWWKTAPWVWRASVTRGIPVYFVQDIETSYYGDSEEMRNRVLASYREEFRYMTISEYNRQSLRELGLDAALIPPGIDLENFRSLERPKRDDVLLAIGRSNPLKNLPLTLEAWRQLEPRPELCMFGIEPELGGETGIRYVEAPSDEQVNELMNEATVFVQTSRHEGFCLPLLEAMAAGTPVVSTDAHGNRDFCRDGENCLMVESRPDAVAAALGRLFEDPELRGRLVEAGRRTVAEYAWEKRIDQLEEFIERVAKQTDSRLRQADPA